MPRYKITVAYDGTNFHGWQKQSKTPQESFNGGAQAPGGATLELRSDVSGEGQPEPVRTVQGVVEQAVRRVVREPVNILGASRTDAGVHARGQVAAFTTQVAIPVEKLPRAISSRLPDDVRVIDAEIVDESFDPIQGAIAKGYRYRIAHSLVRGRQPLFDRFFVASSSYQLDPELMNEAARHLLGEHDFASFARINHGRLSTVRTIHECKVTATRKRRCHLDIVGNGFLYNMVRIIAGTLVEVGRGVMKPEDMPRMLEARNRDAAGPTLPPEGLCLMWIRYPEAGLKQSV